MAESEVKSAALWLGKLVAAEINYLGSVRGKVQRLSTELKTLAAFLNDVAKSRRQDEVVKSVLSEGRNEAYECQDVIETYMLEVARYGYEEYEGCQLGSIMRYACLLRKAVLAHGIGSTIDEINGRILELRSRITSYAVPAVIIGAGDSNPTRRHQCNEPLRRVYSHEREEYVVVGFEKHLEDLVGRLLNPADRTVIVICGMGGVGKSTLAKELYHHPDLTAGGYFKAIGWAPASQQFQLDQVLQTLMYSLVPENDHEGRAKIDQEIRANRAHAALAHLMTQVRCLVVIDDIWTPHDWKRLKPALPIKNEAGSRIILTTRNQEILKDVDPTLMHLHPIKGLDDKRSWELFEKITFPGSTCTDSKKKELGEEMLRHCNGVPLAIIVLGKALTRKESVEAWRQLRNDISAQIHRGGAANVAYGQVYDVLQVSYDDLPSHLKHCFLHLANFPEDYEISTDKLYQLWVGEGIVVKEDTDDESEEDMAEKYLNQLVNRSMVQVASWVGTERIKTCRLHDLMRDVCIDIARREGFVQTIKCNRTMLLRNKKNPDHLLMTQLPLKDKMFRRRIAVYMSDQEAQSSTSPDDISTSANVSRAPNLRSLLLFPVDEQIGEEDSIRFIETIVKDYPLLRVFDCENFHMKGIFPKKVEKLIHLRYLGLANTRVSELPSSIEKLQWLQTLDLRVDRDMVLSLPNVLWRMKQLRHVYLPHYGGLSLRDIDKIADARQRYSIKGGGGMLLLDGLWNLQTIIYLDLDRVDLKGVSKLERLRWLSAVCETNNEALHPFVKCSSLKSFTLKLHTRILNKDPMILSSCEAIDVLLDLYAEPHASFRFTHPFCLEMFPKTLVSLGVWYHKFDEDPFPVLEKLPNLHYLGLALCYNGSRMVCSAGGFPELTEMYLDGLFSLRHWMVEKGALHKLKSLLIINCPVKPIPGALPDSVNVNRIGVGALRSTISNIWDVSQPCPSPSTICTP